MRVRWTPSAAIQLKQQRRYLEEHSQQAADRLMRDVRNASELLARNPEFGRPVSTRAREWGLGRSKQYVLRYVVEPVVIQVVGFWHTAQLRPLPI
ncbi:type II toxin-antitoxin system RelE/ParE family toxin [Roseateles noduli]|jgi:plasmid stabilization system protein ParE|uniref:type II toxin-antitoxin system RelE/ParE family toxin n=1 Tax=Roseateles noduli TaxID=2052484 RepID=UPI003D65922D